MEELFSDILPTKFNVIQHEDKETSKKFNLKFEIKKTDTIREILEKISLSLENSNSNHIFAFINYPKISKRQIEELEEKIITDKDLLKLLKDNFKDFKELNKTSEFVDKNDTILKGISPKRGGKAAWRRWFKLKSVQYSKEYDKLKGNEYNSEIFNNINCISHEIEDIKLDIFSDKTLDKNLINNDNSIKLLNIQDKTNNTLILENYDNLTIHFVSLNDYIKFIKKNIQ